MSTKPPGIFLAVLSSLLFVSLSLRADQPDLAPLDSLWQSAGDTEVSWDNRRQLYEEWNSVAASYGVRSSSAFHNLAYGDWKSGNIPLAIVNILEAMKQSTSISQTWSYVRDLSKLEQRLGNKEQLSDSVSFRLYYLANANVRLLLFVGLIWSLLAGVLLYALRRRFPVPQSAHIALAIVIAILGVTAGWCHANNLLFSGVGVLNSREGHVQTFLDQNPEKSLVKLPAGTVVRVLKKKKDLVQIDFPVAAWIRSADLALVLAVNR